MARKKCFLFCPPSGNIARKDFSWFVHLGNNVTSLLIIRFVIVGPEKSSDDKERSSHIKPICKALYNSLFNQVVSACHASLVIVWNLETGEKVIQFSNAHPQSEITAMCFDQSLRRLVTGMVLMNIPLLYDGNVASIIIQSSLYYGTVDLTTTQYENEYDREISIS